MYNTGLLPLQKFFYFNATILLPFSLLLCPCGYSLDYFLKDQSQPTQDFIIFINLKRNVIKRSDYPV